MMVKRKLARMIRDGRDEERINRTLAVRRILKNNILSQGVNIISQIFHTI